MNITFEGKDTDSIDTLTYSWFIESPVNDYRITIELYGIENEDGEIDPESASFADVNIYEVGHNDRAILDEVKALIDDRIETQYYSEPIMICAPDIRDTLYTRNETSFDSTIADFNAMQAALAAILMVHENNGIFTEG